MKKTISLILILLCSCLVSTAQKEKLIAFKPGTVLVYEMQKNNQKYPLTITIDSIKPNIVFSFILESPEKKSGQVTISEKALLTSSKLVFDFNQPKQILKDATCFFFSKNFNTTLDSIATQIYWERNESADSAALPIKIDNSDSPIMLGRLSKEVGEIKVNGKSVKLNTYNISQFKDSKGNPLDFGTSYIFSIAINTEFPLITSTFMVTYGLELIEVKNAQWLRLNYATNEYERVNEIDD
jgi:hypothetical protein